MTTSTLAGEYVTARDYVGGRASRGNFETSSSCTRRGIREKLCWTMYVLSKRVAADYGTRGRYDPPKLWISVFSFVFLLLCQGKGGTEVDTSAWRLSEAKTQRRPRARERE